MTEEEHYEDVDLSDIIDDTDIHFLNNSEHLERIEPPLQDSETLNIDNSYLVSLEEQISEERRPQVQKSELVRLTKLPMARIKSIMKMDPDVNVISGDAVFVVTKATELFLETIAKETFQYTASNKRKTIAKKDFDIVVNKVDCLCFLEGAMDF